MDVADVEKQVSALDIEVRQAMQAGRQGFNREFKDLMDVLELLVAETKLHYPNTELISSLGMAARYRWGNIAKTVLEDNLSGKRTANHFELDLLSKTKIAMDSLLPNAENLGRTIEGDPILAVDNSEVSREHPTMTDLTRQEVDAKLAQNKAEVDARLANFDTSVKTGFAELRAEFAALRTEIADGRTDAAKQAHDSMKWIIGTVAGMISLAVAVIGLMINLNKGEKSPAPQSGTVIITVPGAMASPAQAPVPTK